LGRYLKLKFKIAAFFLVYSKKRKDGKMKRVFLTVVFLIFFLPGFVSAEYFLGVPLVDDFRIISKTDNRIEIATLITHDQILVFYKERLKGLNDIKFHDWIKEGSGRSPGNNLFRRK
jgi:hypothetical protein